MCFGQWGILKVSEFGGFVLRSVIFLNQISFSSSTGQAAIACDHPSVLFELIFGHWALDDHWALGLLGTRSQGTRSPRHSVARALGRRALGRSIDSYNQLLTTTEERKIYVLNGKK